MAKSPIPSRDAHPTHTIVVSAILHRRLGPDDPFWESTIDPNSSAIPGPPPLQPKPLQWPQYLARRGPMYTGGPNLPTAFEEPDLAHITANRQIKDAPGAKGMVENRWRWKEDGPCMYGRRRADLDCQSD
ncbi:Hypothetical predicted protein [Lecanosticta acicola]|uniref:Uncharacterized protein n=1 Tax=Lecanosticta acicola TaxID=111012 RepID=A0AAI8YZ18_9PEZI|nr:Hypothetical predicted protein [Lecanosticta acicola]